MSHELLYTSSAAKGLFESGRGFCTVMATEGLSEPLRKRLESLSGYRHPFMPGDPNYARNPVVFSHLRIPDRTRNLHLLSRVADFGLDYSNRTNKLAHHVLLEPQERAPGGPAWLLAQPS